VFTKTEAWKAVIVRFVACSSRARSFAFERSSGPPGFRRPERFVHTDAERDLEYKIIQSSAVQGDDAASNELLVDAER
jgi:hypothetical protein